MSWAYLDKGGRRARLNVEVSDVRDNGSVMVDTVYLDTSELADDHAYRDWIVRISFGIMSNLRLSCDCLTGGSPLVEVVRQGQKGCKIACQNKSALVLVLDTNLVQQQYVYFVILSGCMSISKTHLRRRTR